MTRMLILLLGLAVVSGLGRAQFARRVPDAAAGGAPTSAAADQPCRVEMTFSQLTKLQTASVLGKRVAKMVRIWVAVASNPPGCPQVIVAREGMEAALVRESQRQGQGVQVADRDVVAMVVNQEAPLGPWRRFASGLEMIAFTVANVELIANIMGPSGEAVLIGSLPLVHRLSEAARSRAPAMDNITELAEPRVLVLEAGAAGAMRLFSAPHEGKATYHVTTGGTK